MVQAKEVEIKKSDAFEISDAIGRLAVKEWKLNVGHRLALGLRNVKAEVMVLIGMQDKLVEKYVERDEDGKKKSSQANKGVGWVLADPMAYSDEWDEFVKEEMTLSIYPINVSEFGKQFTIPPADFEVLERVGILVMDIGEQGKQGEGTEN